ncbi:efflux RND transporter permease subunit [Sphingobacterium paramultivorum]|uniref:Efflux RND transporter permease subunit n=1 Tax=Sphingobacterium paramultivorum TaxID=2886510 RepID=A0A7G5E2F4_9SPHI|nr:efflux RND transporter permease subunit [Sphingobacterium paramultivorum]QMV68179.1 efflux RND transporter permease subunit [Sphingobacterium paramultivorum]WSO17095.1 efflux RND transporter permease subunit [Sphingobacterium paramultivorum]
MKKSFFVTYKIPLFVSILLIIMGGIYAYSKIHAALFPQITFPKIKIIADAGQQPIDQMTVGVTKILEDAIKKVPDLQLLKSTTSRGSCEISAFMSWDMNIDLAKQQIESSINQIRNQLPSDINITVEKMNPAILPVIGYSLNSNTLDPIELKQLALYTIKPFLSQVPGVSEVRIISGQDKEYQVLMNQQMMARLGITSTKIEQAINSTNFIKSNGYSADFHFLYLTLTDAQIRNEAQLQNLVISNDGNRIVKLGDIAQIMVHQAKQYIKVNANGQESILLAVIQQPNANVVDVTTAMEAKISELQKTLPKDLTLKPYYVQADFVKDSIKSVTDALWIGLLLAIIVAVIFLRSWKASLVILITIPITLALTILSLYAMGQTFNIMTLGAIAAAIGLIIDDGIVVVEQIHRTHEEHPEETATTLVQKAINYLLKAMIGSSLSTIVIFLPFMLMSGVAGAYFKVMTDTMILTLICSFFASSILLPVIYLFFSSEKKRQHTSQHHDVKERKWVGFFLARPWLSYSFIVILILCAMVILPKIDTGFLPEMDEGSIVLDYNSPPGTSLEETDRELKQVEKIITSTPEVEAYSRRTGTQMGFFITEPNRGDYLIQLKKQRNKTTNEVTDEIRNRIEASGLPLTVDFGQVIGDMLGDLMSSVQPIEIKIFGTDQRTIQAYSKKIASIVQKVNGTADVFDGIIIAGPSIIVNPKFPVLAQYNISLADFQSQLQTNLDGNIVGNIFDKVQYTPIRLLYNSRTNQSLSDINNSMIALPNGILKPLSEFANVTITAGSAEINREDLQSLGIVTARLDNGDLGGTIQSIRQQIDQQIKLPTGYSIIYGGAYAEQQQSFGELLTILLISCLLVFAIMLFLFRNFLLALTILFISTLGISGGIILLYLTSTPLNVGSYTGLIMMVGIIGENAIFTYLQFQETLATKTKAQAIIYAISTRLRPKLMTAIGAIIALMPLALGIGTGAQMHQPLAIAVIGGFIVALPLLLIVFPTLLNKINFRAGS